ncbi:MAG: cell division protein FtsX [Betaproteobacteria bacterium RIFCSPLOWO2_02_FULL_65_24]|nr:MAG: cell division protein FtsX [Betaproteobacteria bacterium RIFCSPLOWO2_02_FULL_65_24]
MPRSPCCGTLPPVQYELFIGLRYTRARNRRSNGNSGGNFISFIALVSMLGIALGVAALIVVLSVMNGFQKELRARILGVASHVQITGPDNRLADWPEVAAGAEKHPQVRASAPYVNAQAMLTADSLVRGTLVRGILPDQENRVADIGEHMVAGRLDALRPGEFGIVLGGELARALRVRPGQRVTMIAPQGLVTPAGLLPRLKQFTVVGIFEVGMFEYDSGLALIHLDDAKLLFQLGEQVSGVRLRLEDLFESRAVARDLGTSLGRDVYISDWTRSHANFFRAVQIEKNVMFIILMLIVAVAAFNIVSTLVMAVTDKQADIAILRTLGATPRGIMKIFVIHGALIGIIGTLAGVAGGVVLALNVDVVVPFFERLLNVRFLSKEVYYISELPSDLQQMDVLTVALVSLALSFLATLYPSWHASRVNPAEALRYE